MKKEDNAYTYTIQDLLTSFLSDIKNPSFILRRRWKNIVGEELCEKSFLSAVKNQTLYVKVKDSSAAALFMLRKEQIIANVLEELKMGEKSISKIKCIY